MAYQAPFLLTNEHLDTLPEGVFIVPLCTTRERFKKITNALWAGGFDDSELGSYDHLVDFLEAIPRIRDGCEYTPVETCQTIDLNSPLVTWYPESPYNPDEEIPSGYNAHPYTIVTDSIIDQIVLQFGLGYKVGDVLTDFSKIPIGSSWEDLLTTQYLNFPRIRISGLEGSGKVKLHLLSIPQGGRAWIIIDDVIHIIPQDNIFVELDMDLTSFPPETSIAEVLELEVSGVGGHHIDIVFIPAMDVAFIPLFFGGGIRSIELCGFGLENTLTQYCCDETNGLLRVNNQLLEKIMLMLKNGFEIKPIEALLGDSLPPVCVPIGYDSDTGDSGVEAQRLGALCYTITAYVEAVMLKAFRKMLMPIDMLLTIMPNFDDLPPQFRDVEIDLFAGSTLAALIAGYTNNDAKTLLKCTMQQALEGQINSFDIFRNSVKAANNTDYMTRFLWIMIEQANQSVKNWNLFGQVLNWAFELPDIENFACPCVVDSCVSADDIILVADTPDTTLEKLTASTWRVISTYKPMDDPARPDATAAAIKDQYGRCVDFVSFTQTQSDGTTWDCSGQPTYSIGGQGGVAEKVGWRLWDGTTIDTVVTIDCVT